MIKFAPYVVCNQEIFRAAVRSQCGIEPVVIDIPEIMVEGMTVRLQILRWARTVRALTTLIKQHGINLVYCNSGITSQTGFYAARLAGLPVLVHIHANYTLRYILLYRFHKATKVVFVSKAMMDFITQKAFFTGSCEVVYNGIDTDEFCPAPARLNTLRAAFGITSDTIVIGQVGSLIERKGPDILIRAFDLVRRKEPNVHLVFVGDGPERDTCFALMKALGLEKQITFTGQQDDPLRFYQHLLDINVLASRREAMGLTLLEGAACGLPAVAARVGGMPEGVIEEETGLLFDREDVSTLATQLHRLVSDTSLRRTYGEAARRMVLERFSLEAYVQRMNAIMEDLCK